MIEYVVCDGTGRLSEDIIKLQVGDSQAVLGTVFLAGEHVGKLETVTHQVAELADFRRRNKAWFYHVAHEQVADSFCVLAVSLIPLLRLSVFGMRKGNKTGFFEDVEYRDPILAG